MPKYILTRLTCILAASCLAEFTRLASADRPLRIVTFNAQVLAAPRTRDSMISRFRFDAARQRHFEKVASVIETLEPDILNLVEVTSAAGVQLLVDILHEKGMDDYRGYHVDSKDSFSGFDVALISRIEPDFEFCHSNLFRISRFGRAVNSNLGNTLAQCTRTREFREYALILK